MPQYHFKTAEFGVSDDGIHFLRSGFNYKTISYTELSRAQVIKGKELHNWLAIFSIGALLVIFGFLYSIRTVDVLLSGRVTMMQAKLIFILLVPVVGIYFVYTSLRTGPLLLITHGKDKKDKFPLRDIIQNYKFKEFKDLMREKLGSKYAEAI